MTQLCITLVFTFLRLSPYISFNVDDCEIVSYSWKLKSNNLYFSLFVTLCSYLSTFLPDVFQTNMSSMTKAKQAVHNKLHACYNNV